MSVLSDGSSATFRAEVRQFLLRELPADWKGIGALDAAAKADFIPRWRELLFENRLLAVGWPEEYGGRGLGVYEQAVIQEEFVSIGAPLTPLLSDSFGINLLGPTLLAWGDEKQRSFFLPRILSGEHRWAQGYSEPEAGSDLFSLRTTGRLQPDGSWRIDGQKIWQTGGAQANWIFALVRTEEGVIGAQGISMVLLPLDQPGVTVRPIRTMAGTEELSEVFLTDAVADGQHVIGGRGNGAKVAVTLLGHERAGAGALHVRYERELSRVVELVREAGLDKDAHVRQRIGGFVARVASMGHLAERSVEGAAAGAPPNAASSLVKLYETEYHSELTDFVMEAMGMDGAVRSWSDPVAELGPDPVGTPNSSDAWSTAYLMARAATIYGGSSQIQRTTLAERVLSLPKEPRLRENRNS